MAAGTITRSRLRIARGQGDVIGPASSPKSAGRAARAGARCSTCSAACGTRASGASSSSGDGPVVQHGGAVVPVRLDTRGSRGLSTRLAFQKGRFTFFGGGAGSLSSSDSRKYDLRQT